MQGLFVYIIIDLCMEYNGETRDGPTAISNIYMGKSDIHDVWSIILSCNSGVFFKYCMYMLYCMMFHF